MRSITPPERLWTRRTALERGFASVAALCLLPTAARNATVLRTTATAAAAAVAPYQVDLQLPPTLVPVSSTGVRGSATSSRSARAGPRSSPGR